MSKVEKNTHEALDDFSVRLNANRAKRRLRAYIERHFGEAEQGRRRFLKELRARLLLHGTSLQQHIGHADFESLKEAVANRDLSIQPKLNDVDCADRLREVISQSVNKKYRPLQQNHASMVEILFDLQEGYLSRVPEKKMPAYVMLQCMGQSALPLMNKIKAHPIVDEVALLVGDADLYIRIFGTDTQLKDFLLEDLYTTAEQVAVELQGSNGKLANNSSIIYSTKTYTSFADTYFLKYHPSVHPAFENSRVDAKLQCDNSDL